MKIKHLSGAFRDMPDFPTSSDIKYMLGNVKNFSIKPKNKLGVEDLDKLAIVVDEMVTNNQLTDKNGVFSLKQ